MFSQNGLEVAWEMTFSNGLRREIDFSATAKGSTMQMTTSCGLALGGNARLAARVTRVAIWNFPHKDEFM
jgi:hypothetical protein